MAGYEIFIKPSAVRELEGLPLKPRRQIVTRIRSLSGVPRPHGAEKLSGSERYRIRQGDYRVLYEIEDTAHRVVVVRIGHRREVYR